MEIDIWYDVLQFLQQNFIMNKTEESYQLDKRFTTMKQNMLLIAPILPLICYLYIKIKINCQLRNKKSSFCLIKLSRLTNFIAC